MPLTELRFTIGPPPERQQHNRVSRDLAQIVDANGAIGSPFRVESLLGRLERHGDIGPRERAAGETFRYFFHVAHLDPLRAADMLGYSSATHIHATPRGRNRSEWAKRKIYAALDALGGQGSPCGSCAWFVLGLEFSMREWALRQGWSGRPIRRELAKGMLLGALGVLATHFSIGKDDA